MSRSIEQREPSHGEIAQLAYEFWEKSGKPADREVEFWLQAEQLLRSRTVPAARPPQPRSVRPAANSQPRQMDRRFLKTAAA